MIAVGLGAAPLWRWAYRLRLARQTMPQWRVVIEAVRWVGQQREVLVCGVLVWAPDAEEAEALARLAVEQEDLETVTADARPTPPQWRPSSHAQAVARTPYNRLVDTTRPPARNREQSS